MLCLLQKAPGGDGEDIAVVLSMSVTLQLRKGTGRQPASELARITGKGFAFTPNNPGEAVNLDVKDFPLWDVLEVLSQSGKVQIGGHDFSKLQAVRKALVSGESMSPPIGTLLSNRIANWLRAPLQFGSGIVHHYLKNSSFHFFRLVSENLDK
jgi:hypothetical protein